MTENTNISPTTFETEDGYVKAKKLTPYEAAFMIIGVNIGSGILSLAYSSRLGGWPILCVWLIISAFIVTISMLYVAEVCLRTKKVMQLPGLAERYLGKTGSVLIFIGVCCNSLGCMVGYTTGSGSIIANWFGCSQLVGGLIFSIPAILVVFFGLKTTGVAQKVISTGMIVLLIGLVIGSFCNANADAGKAMYVDVHYALPLLNMAIFCHITQYAVPDIVRGLRHDPKKIAPSIIGAKVVVTTLLCAVPLAVIALTGPENVTQVATIAWGNALGPVVGILANLFALTAMMTSYWTHCSSMLSNVVDLFKKDEDNKTVRIVGMTVVAGVPLALALSGAVGFVDGLSFAGAYGGIIMCVLPIFMLRKARVEGDQEPPWKCGWIFSKWVQYAIIIAFIFSTGYKTLSLFGLLPAGW